MDASMDASMDVSSYLLIPKAEVLQDHVIVVGDIFHRVERVSRRAILARSAPASAAHDTRRNLLTLELADRISGPASRSLPPKSACTHITYYIY